VQGPLLPVVGLLLGVEGIPLPVDLRFEPGDDRFQ
jgi:hypothetical protein